MKVLVVGMGFVGKGYMVVFCVVGCEVVGMVGCIDYVLCDVVDELMIFYVGIDWVVVLVDFKFDIVFIVILGGVYYDQIKCVVVVGCYVFCDKLMMMMGDMVSEFYRQVQVVGIKIVFVVSF